MQEALNLDDPRPPYKQIAAHLRAAIQAEELPPGAKLDSVRALAARYEVAQTTIQQALRVLRDEGLIVSWQGRGVFVRNPAYETDGDKVDTNTIMTQLDAMLDRMEQMESDIGALEKKFEALVRSRKKA